MYIMEYLSTVNILLVLVMLYKILVTNAFFLSNYKNMKIEKM